MPQLSEYEKLSLKRLEERILEDKWSVDGLVQLIELSGQYLNIQTIPDYAKTKKLTYNGVKKTREIREIFNVKFIIENN